VGEHQRHRQTAGDKVRSQAPGEHRFPIFKAKFPERRHTEAIRMSFVATPDVVNQQVDPGLFLSNTLEEGLDLGVDSMIADDANSPASTLVDMSSRRFECSLVTTGHLDRGAGITERQSDTAANAFRGSRNDRHTVSQVWKRVAHMEGNYSGAESTFKAIVALVVTSPCGRLEDSRHGLQPGPAEQFQSAARRFSRPCTGFPSTSTGTESAASQPMTPRDRPN